MNKTLLFVAILLAVFVTGSLGANRLLRGDLTSGQARSLLNSINAERKKLCLKPLKYSNSLQSSARGVVRRCTLSSTNGYAGLYLRGNSYSLSQLAGANYPYRVIDSNKRHWNCATDTCRTNKHTCLLNRQAMNPRATQMGVAAAKCFDGSKYRYFYQFRFNAGGISLNPIRNFIPANSCAGRCSARPRPSQPRPPTKRPSPPRPRPPTKRPPTKRPSPPRPSPSPPSAPNSEAQAWVDEHNKVRRCMGSLVSWDSALARTAKQWSDRMARENCAMYHSSRSQRNNAGENLYKIPGGTRVQNIQAGVRMWNDEAKAWNCASNRCSRGVRTNVQLPGGQTFQWTISSCGHYTQNIWRDTTKIGCAVTKCPNAAHSIGTCHYKSPGNFNGRHPLSSNGDSSGPSRCAACSANSRSGAESTFNIEEQPVDDSVTANRDKGFFSNGAKVGGVFGTLGALVVAAAVVVVVLVVRNKKNKAEAEGSDYILFDEDN